MSLKMTNLKIEQHLPGANELNHIAPHLKKRGTSAEWYLLWYWPKALRPHLQSSQIESSMTHRTMWSVVPTKEVITISGLFWGGSKISQHHHKIVLVLYQHQGLSWKWVIYLFIYLLIFIYLLLFIIHLFIYHLFIYYLFIILHVFICLSIHLFIYS